jgi:hypothetical protein
VPQSQLSGPKPSCSFKSDASPISPESLLALSLWCFLGLARPHKREQSFGATPATPKGPAPKNLGLMQEPKGPTHCSSPERDPAGFFLKVGCDKVCVLTRSGRLTKQPTYTLSFAVPATVLGQAKRTTKAKPKRSEPTQQSRLGFHPTLPLTEPYSLSQGLWEGNFPPLGVKQFHGLDEVQSRRSVSRVGWTGNPGVPSP